MGLCDPSYLQTHLTSLLWPPTVPTRFSASSLTSALRRPSCSPRDKRFCSSSVPVAIPFLGTNDGSTRASGAFPFPPFPPVPLRIHVTFPANDGPWSSSDRFSSYPAKFFQPIPGTKLIFPGRVLYLDGIYPITCPSSNSQSRSLLGSRDVMR